MVAGEAAEGQVPATSGMIMAGPGDSIFDDIFDWIANAISTITRNITAWISKAWSGINRTITTWVSWLWDQTVKWFKLTWDTLISWVKWLWSQIEGWFKVTWSTIIEGTTGLQKSIQLIWQEVTPVLKVLDLIFLQPSKAAKMGVTAAISFFDEHGGDILRFLDAFFLRPSDIVKYAFDWWIEYLKGWFTEDIPGHSPRWKAILDAVGNWFLDFWKFRLKDFLAFLDEFFLEPQKMLQVAFNWWMKAVEGWFTEDIPDHSPRWKIIFESIGKWIKTWAWEFPAFMLENPPERISYGLSASFEYIGDMFNEIFTNFNDTIVKFAAMMGPMSPSLVATQFPTIAKTGLVALAGLAGMTIAGESLGFFKHLGLGHISAMIYDMTNYKVITGAFIGVMAATMLKQPLTYYFNNLFRPWLIRQGDFLELMSRRAFTEPEVLQNKALIESMHSLAPGGGASFESAIIGYYGYPPEYIGLFKELANTRLGYFALAGVARTGFYEENWFREALHRTGYSATAVRALQNMMYELFVSAKLLPVMSQIRRLYREGFNTKEEVMTLLDEAINQPTLADVRLMAMDLEQEYESKSMALDISLRSFSRGIIPETEVRKNLAGLIKRSGLIDLHMDREKLGLIRRITWAMPEDQAPFQIVEE